MHRLLKRQIKRYLGNDEQLLGKLKPLLESVDEAYRSYDEDFRQLERTLEISSKESFKELSDFRYAMSISAMVVITDGRGIIKFVNRLFVEASGYTEKELLGRKMSDFNSDYHDNAFYEAMYKKILAGKVWKGEMRDVTKDGRYYWTDTTIVPLTNEVGHPYKFITYKSDISAMKQTQKELEEAKSQAENALRIKSEFLSNMSHEIRTPMNAILGLTDLLLRKKHDEETMGNLLSIKHSGENLLVIINDILDFSKLEAGKVQLEDIDFNFNYQIKHIKKMLDSRAAGKGIYLKTQIDQAIPNYMKGDPYRINQVLINLAGNAIKFTAVGGVVIKARLQECNDDVCVIRYEVADTGIGIPHDQLDKIFESFSQAGVNITRTYGGTGLGLAISMELVKLMGGRIWVESEENKGSHFFFEIPLRKSNKKQLKEESPDIPEVNLEQVKVVVFEDNLINQKVISQNLRKWNADYEIFENGEAGLKYLENHRADIILMDLQMPVKDGFETAGEIRRGFRVPHLKNVPILALTADAFVETKTKVLDAGMDDFVTKPFKSRELNNKIAFWLEQSKKRR